MRLEIAYPCLYRLIFSILFAHSFIYSLGLTAFHLACQSEELSCINYLLEQDCDVFAQDDAGRTGLDHLLYEDNIRLVK